jgi:hypothetical protein
MRLLKHRLITVSSSSNLFLNAARSATVHRVGAVPDAGHGPASLWSVDPVPPLPSSQQRRQRVGTRLAEH